MENGPALYYQKCPLPSGPLHPSDVLGRTYSWSRPGSTCLAHPSLGARTAIPCLHTRLLHQTELLKGKADLTFSVYHPAHDDGLWQGSPTRGRSPKYSDTWNTARRRNRSEGSPLTVHLWLFPWGGRGQTSLGSLALPSFNRRVTVKRVKQTQGESTQETWISQDIKRLGCTKASLLSIASSLKNCLYTHFTDYKTGSQIRNDLSISRLRSKLWNYSFVVLYIFILPEKSNVH